MDLIIYAGAAIAGIILLIAVVRVFIAPIKLILKLAFNTVLGFAGLIVLDHFGAYIGISLGVNLINAAVVGIFGLPGLALLLLLKWFCGI
ncbi:MAG: pro-sigmaK processing inhibitor BofA family protein [Clostridiales bacterium]|nr:pro-sigmaK processing inhibitor BofA family protein [Clostridiales bacterium]